MQPDLDDIRKVTPRTKAIVVINPNNPTGAVYPARSLKASPTSRASTCCCSCSDEIYDRILSTTPSTSRPRRRA